MSIPVVLATGFWARWRGLRSRLGGGGLLLRTRSVHGVGMARPLAVLALDADGTVVAVRQLQPGRVVIVAVATWMVELPAGHPLPPVGSRLRARPILAT